jgi:hypothetical protein
VLTRDEECYGLLGCYKEELSAISPCRSCCSLLTLKLCALNLFSHPSFIGLLHAVGEVAIMRCPQLLGAFLVRPDLLNMSAFGGKADITRTCADVCF